MTLSPLGVRRSTLVTFLAQIYQVLKTWNLVLDHQLSYLSPYFQGKFNVHCVQLLRENKWKMLATPNPNDTFVTIFLYEGFPCTFYPLCYISTKDVFGSFIYRIVFTSFTAKRAKTQANNIEKNLQFINLSTYYREIYMLTNLWTASS